MKYSLKELYLIWLDSFKGLEYKHKLKLYESFNNEPISEHINKNKDYIIEKLGDNTYNSMLSACKQEYLDFVIENLDKKQVKVICYCSDNFPEELKETPCPPLVLYYKGNINLIKEKKLTVVGSRKSTELALIKAEEFTNSFIKAGFIVVTGIAEGVDEKVIETGIVSGKIISVLAGGFNNIYPKSNNGLFNKLAEKGLVISEYSPDTITESYHYFARNRILAGLSKATVVLSGGAKSGTNITANYAEDYSRTVFALPYSVNVPSGEGCNNLIKNGAVLITSAEEILEFFGIESKKETVEMTKEEKKLYDIISEGEIHIEKLCLLLNKKVFEILPVLTVMEIKKLVIKSGNCYSIV